MQFTPPMFSPYRAHWWYLQQWSALFTICFHAM